MRHPWQEHLWRKQREWHRSHPRWAASKGGLFVPHDFTEMKPDGLSWWDDVGFILGRRRVMVWWRHPRDAYRQAIEDRAMGLAGELPRDSGLLDAFTPNYRKVGRSRKKIVSYTLREPSPEWRAHYERCRQLETELSEQGIDFEVHPGSKRVRLAWATGLELVAPLEVRSEQELAALAHLARRLLLGETSLVREFGNYCYTKEAWLAEAAARARGHGPPN